MPSNKSRSRVFFVGAGPGDPELLTLKARRHIEEADLVLYTGSLVPREVIAFAQRGARIVDSSSMTLEETHETIMETVRKGGKVARVHTGDPSLYGAIREQMGLLEQESVAFEVVPGVSAAFAAAAAAMVSFTMPEKTQTLIITRMGGRTPVPEKERVSELARHGTSMAIYLSASTVEQMVSDLLEGGYPPETPVVIAYRVGWPEQTLFFTTIEETAATVKEHAISRQAVFLVLPALGRGEAVSRLYSSEFQHGYRKTRE
ncbi:MAG: precorrin-4 C(11)-methyltransferase [Desulfobacteraceae bacterium]|nr:MAG: precorrin-4 C(11)-methyltransferase [Desulfobacteraceae bacterium]